jgi:RNase P subunit RPR2
MITKLKMTYRNTCNKCGKVLVQGEECYANNQDEVLAGKAMCKACAFPKKVEAKVKTKTKAKAQAEAEE